jgi:ELWxxDGT repeat protein
MAADFTLLQDVNPGLPSGIEESDSVVAIGSMIYFSATTPNQGSELWKSDGTTAGTTLVRDIISGSEGSFPADLTNINGVLYFSAINPLGERDLWKSDGTTLGTVVVASRVVPDGFFNGTPPVIAVLGNTLFFRGTSSAGGELWTSNLVTGATSQLADINPGAASSDPGSLTVLNGAVYFSADDGVNGRELWRSNGTVTERVADVWPGSDGSSPNNFEVLGNRLYFAATTLAEGTELWTTDGVTTTLVQDITAGPNSSNPANLTALNGTLIFTTLAVPGAPEVWVSTGTGLGTTRVFNGFSTRDFIFDLGRLTIIGNSVYMSVLTDPVVFGNPPTYQIWKSDGTSVGTVVASELTNGTRITDPKNVVRAGSLTYFRGSLLTSDGAIPAVGSELFVTNQTPVDLNLSSTVVAENSVIGTPIGTLSTLDPNGFDSFQYSLVAGLSSNDNNLFTIVGNTLLVNGAINFEATPTLSVRIRTTDNANLTFDKSITINVTDLAEVLSTVVAGSNAVGSQRSNVRTLAITFDGQVDITGNPFEVRQRGGSTPIVTTAFTTNVNGLGQTVATITFSGDLTRGIDVGVGALLNGYYQLTIDATNVKRSNVNLDGDLNGLPGGNYRFGTVQTDRFFALFGDADGDGNGTIGDNNEFRRTNGRSQGDPLYNDAFNFDGVGRIAIEDRNELRRTLRLRTLPFV